MYKFHRSLKDNQLNASNTLATPLSSRHSYNDGLRRWKICSAWDVERLRRQESVTPNTAPTERFMSAEVRALKQRMVSRSARLAKDRYLLELICRHLMRRFNGSVNNCLYFVLKLLSARRRTCNFTAVSKASLNAAVGLCLKNKKAICRALQ